jgi:hypothetical protein
MLVTIHEDSIGNLVIYSDNYLFDKKMLIIDKMNKTQLNDFLSLLSEDQRRDVRNGWTVKVEISQTHKEVYFE